MTSDESFLLFSGGMELNCLNNILNTKNNNDDNELPIIRRSSYYDADMFSILAEKNKHNLSVLSSNIQSINQILVNLRLLLTNCQHLTLNLA